MRIDERQENLNREKTLEELHKEIRNSKRKFKQSAAMAFVSLVIIIYACIAWFVSNNRVSSTGGQISANGEYLFSLATLKEDSQGIYDGNSEESSTTPLAKALNRYFRADRKDNENNNSEEEKWNYFSNFLNLPNLSPGTTEFKDIKGDNYILGDSEKISLRVNDTSNVSNTKEYDYVGPGSYGQFTFYIIPHKENFEKVTISVSLQPFTLVKVENKDNTGKAVPVNVKENEVLMNMLKGHILLFLGKDTNGDYSDRILPNLKEDGRISFTFDKNRENTEWVKDQAEPITVYWIWPRRFENIKYYGHEDSVFMSNCESYSDLLQWVNDNRGCIVNTLTVDSTLLVPPSDDMTNTQFAQWSTGYNKGDQLIGENIAFFQWIIEAE